MSRFALVIDRQPHAPWTPGERSSPEAVPRLDDARLQGECLPRFEHVREALRYNLSSGEDIGASVAVFVDGEPVVDLWGGYFDARFDQPWERDTIIATHSVTKTMTAIAALVLADSGELDLDAPVAKYWPAFGAAGKQGIRVRQVLGHTSGIPGWTQDVSWGDVYDLEYSSALLAAQAPWWRPGTAAAFHGINQGHLVSGVIHAITGMTLGEYFAEHVAGPIGADYHIGTGPGHDHRISSFVQSTAEDIPRGNWVQERVGLNPNLTPQASHSIAWRRAEIGAANGHGNARSIATLMALLACGESRGVRMLSQKGRERMLETQWDGIDRVLGVPVRWGMGAALRCAAIRNSLDHRIAGCGGCGGLLAFADLDARLSIGYAMNRWMAGPYAAARFNRFINAAYAGLAAR